MKTRSRYIFGAAIAATAGFGLVQNAGQALGATLASWTFESLTATSTAAAVGPFTADVGVGSASGVHASATSVWTFPAGNGSAKTLSSNQWAVGDYYQFTSPTTGFENIMVNFDQTGSNTGPGYFTLQYSTDGSTFSDFASYTLYNGTATAFVVGTQNTALSHTFDLSAITALNNNANAAFRLRDNSVNAFGHETNTAAATVAAAGTDRIDNVFIVGTPPAGVPEPTSIALVGVAGLGLLSRRRRD